MKHITVAAAILVQNGAILCLRRGASPYDYIRGKFEFPGGKVEAGETPAAALARELREELDLSVPVAEQDFYMVTEYTYPDFSITLYTYKIVLADRQFTMKEHTESCWLQPQELRQIQWPQANIPILTKLAVSGV
jgi:8-oxo-dGTP diphosphatase